MGLDARCHHSACWVPQFHSAGPCRAPARFNNNSPNGSNKRESVWEAVAIRPYSDAKCASDAIFPRLLKIYLHAPAARQRRVSAAASRPTLPNCRAGSSSHPAAHVSALSTPEPLPSRRLPGERRVSQKTDPGADRGPGATQKLQGWQCRGQGRSGCPTLAAHLALCHCESFL